MNDLSQCKVRTIYILFSYVSGRKDEAHAATKMNEQTEQYVKAFVNRFGELLEEVGPMEWK